MDGIYRGKRQGHRGFILYYEEHGRQTKLGAVRTAEALVEWVLWHASKVRDQEATRLVLKRIRPLLSSDFYEFSREESLSHLRASGRAPESFAIFIFPGVSERLFSPSGRIDAPVATTAQPRRPPDRHRESQEPTAEELEELESELESADDPLEDEPPPTPPQLDKRGWY